MHLDLLEMRLGGFQDAKTSLTRLSPYQALLPITWRCSMSRLKYKHGKITVQPYNCLEVELNSHM